MTVERAATILDRTPATVQGYCRRGWLKATKRQVVAQDLVPLLQNDVRGRPHRVPTLVARQRWVWSIDAKSVHALRRKLRDG